MKLAYYEQLEGLKPMNNPEEDDPIFPTVYRNKEVLEFERREPQEDSLGAARGIIWALFFMLFIYVFLALIYWRMK